MMNVLHKKDIKKLMAKHNGPCVSVFMPTHRGGAESQQDQVRFKNLFREAERTLLKTGSRSHHVKDFLEPAQMLLNDAVFWQNQIDGLSVFLCPDMFRYFRFPHKFKELVVVTDRFHTKPLLPLLSGERQFYVLSLSQNQVSLLQGSRYGIVEVDLKGVPESLADLLRYDNREKQLQFHTGTPGGMGKRSPMFHGHGAGADDAKDNILRYFRQIDKGLNKMLKDEQAPLVLAGVEYLFPIYNEANSYPYLVKKGIAVNTERLSPEDLHEVAWTIVEPYFKKAEKDAVAKYKKFVGTGKTSSDVRKIVSAAYHGQVESLFVAVGVQSWGTFDPSNNIVKLHQEAELADTDLLDFAAIQTFLQGGSVFVVEPDQVPDEDLLAAVFRY